MVTQLSEKQLKALVKRAVQEALKKELMKMRAGLTSFISDTEQRGIGEQYGRPSRRIAAVDTLRI